MASASKKLLKQLPPPDKMREIFFGLLSGADQAVALGTLAYLDHTLEVGSGSASPPRTRSSTACAGRSSRAFRPPFASLATSPRSRRSDRSTSIKPIACQIGSSAVASLARMHDA